MRKYVWRVLWLLFVLPLSLRAAAAQEAVRDVSFQVQGQSIVVSYDLVGKGEYEVSLRLLTDAGTRVAAAPSHLSGDVGRGIPPGSGKKIVWDALRDVDALEGSDYVFEVRAARTGRISKWAWIGGLGVAAGAGVGAAVATGVLGEEKGSIVIDVPDPEP